MTRSRSRRHLLVLAPFLIASSVVLALGVVQAIQLVPFERAIVDKKVAAFYYGWYGNTTDYSQASPVPIIDDAAWRHWNGAGWQPPVNACSVHEPVQGWYDSADPSLIATHIAQAEWAGIDAFVASFWGKNGFEMRNFVNMLEVALHVNASMKFTLYFEIFMGGLDEKPVDEAAAILVDEFTHVHGVLTDPRYENVTWFEDGKPVMFVYVVQAVSKQAWHAALDELAAGGIEFFLVADRPGTDVEFNTLFQASHQYDVYYPTYHGIYHDVYSGLRFTATRHGQVFCAGVSPGYNDDPVFRGNPILDRGEQGSTYRNSWNQALALKPDWITITSWNEWHEGTEIEPSIENGDLALNQTKQYIQEFKSGNYHALQPATVVPSGTWYNIAGLGSAVALVIVVSFLFSRNRSWRGSGHRGLAILATILLVLGTGAIITYGGLLVHWWYDTGRAMVAAPYALLAPVIAMAHAIPLALLTTRMEARRQKP